MLAQAGHVCSLRAACRTAPGSGHHPRREMAILLFCPDFPTSGLILEERGIQTRYGKLTSFTPDWWWGL